MQTEYTNVTFRIRTKIHGSTVAALSSKNGFKLLRVTEDGRDDLTVASARGACEVPWSNVASAILMHAAPAKKGKA